MTGIFLTSTSASASSVSAEDIPSWRDAILSQKTEDDMMILAAKLSSIDETLAMILAEEWHRANE